MMFGWFKPSAIFASSTNIATNGRLRAYAPWIFLITSVLLRPCATVVRARNTSAMPPVPILRISEYFPNCSIREATRSTHGKNVHVVVARAHSSSQRGDHEVVEPRIGLPVVDTEILVTSTFERARILVAQERIV